MAEHAGTPPRALSLSCVCVWLCVCVCVRVCVELALSSALRGHSTYQAACMPRVRERERRGKKGGKVRLHVGMGPDTCWSGCDLYSYWAGEWRRY